MSTVVPLPLPTNSVLSARWTGDAPSHYLSREAAEARVRRLGERLAGDLEHDLPEARARVLSLPRPLVVLALGFLLDADGRRPEAREYALAVALGEVPCPRWGGRP